jgi:hypothetical protein
MIGNTALMLSEERRHRACFCEYVFAIRVR